MLDRLSIFASETAEQISVQAVPEPGTLALTGAALLCLVVCSRWSGWRLNSVSKSQDCEAARMFWQTSDRSRQ
jgi:hypothetical protein